MLQKKIWITTININNQTNERNITLVAEYCCQIFSYKCCISQLKSEIEAFFLNEEMEKNKNKREKFIVKWRKVRAKMKEIRVEREKKMKINEYEEKRRMVELEFLQSRIMRRGGLSSPKNLASLYQRKFLSQLSHTLICQRRNYYRNGRFPQREQYPKKIVEIVEVTIKAIFVFDNKFDGGQLLFQN